MKGYFKKTSNPRYVAKAFLRNDFAESITYKGVNMETTYMGWEAILDSKRGTDAIDTPTSQEKNGAKWGRPVDCTVRTGCKAVIKAGVVKPYGQVCRKETRKEKLLVVQ